SVAVSGDTALVGADFAGGKGAAHIFVRSGSTWTRQQELTASDGAMEDSFGFAVALSGDTALVGAVADDIGANSNQGSVYVFRRTGSTWMQVQKLTATNGNEGDGFGNAIALSGNTALIGAFTEMVGTKYSVGSAHVFVSSGSSWTEQQKLMSSDQVESAN